MFRLLLAILVMIVAAPLAHAQTKPLSAAYQITYAKNYDPSPAPDGKHLVYISMVAGREQLFVMNVDGSGSRQITSDTVDHEDPAWSPD